MKKYEFLFANKFGNLDVKDKPWKTELPIGALKEIKNLISLACIKEIEFKI